MIWRATDKVAIILFGAALLAVVLTNVLPFYEFLESDRDGRVEWVPTYGWSLWSWILMDMVDFEDVSMDNKGPTFGWLLGTLVACVSPFLIRPLAGNRLLWWAFVVFSGLAVFGLTGVIGYQMMIELPDTDIFRRQAGVYWLLIFPVLNFVGLLCVRKRSEPS